MDVAWLSLFNPLGSHLLWGDARSSPKGSQPLRCWDRLQVENPIEFREKREGSGHAGKGTEGHFEIHSVAQVMKKSSYIFVIKPQSHLFPLGPHESIRPISTWFPPLLKISAALIWSKPPSSLFYCNSFKQCLRTSAVLIEQSEKVCSCISHTLSLVCTKPSNGFHQSQSQRPSSSRCPISALTSNPDTLSITHSVPPRQAPCRSLPKPDTCLWATVLTVPSSWKALPPDINVAFYISFVFCFCFNITFSEGTFLATVFNMEFLSAHRHAGPR